MKRYKIIKWCGKKRSCDQKGNKVEGLFVEKFLYDSLEEQLLFVQTGILSDYDNTVNKLCEEAISIISNRICNNWKVVFESDKLDDCEFNLFIESL